MLLAFSIISQSWDGMGIWGPTPWKTMTFLSHIAIIVAADDLVIIEPDINSHRIDLFSPEHTGTSTIRVKAMSFRRLWKYNAFITGHEVYRKSFDFPGSAGLVCPGGVRNEESTIVLVGGAVPILLLVYNRICPSDCGSCRSICPGWAANFLKCSVISATRAKIADGV